MTKKLLILLFCIITQFGFSQNPYIFKNSLTLSNGDAPSGVATNQDGKYYISSLTKIYTYDKSGNLISQFIRQKSNNTPFILGIWVNYDKLVVDSFGNIYVLGNGDSMEKYSPSGTLLYRTEFNNQPLNYVRDICLDKQGNVWILFQTYLVGYKPTGELLKKINSICTDGTGLTIDEKGCFYVGDIYQIKKIDATGKLILTFGTKGVNAGQFYGDDKGTISITLDEQGNIFTGEGNVISQFPKIYLIQQFDSTGKFISSVGIKGNAFNQIGNVADLEFDNKGNLFISDDVNRRIIVFFKDNQKVKNIIKGQVFIDSNGNCIMDEGEKAMSQMLLKVLPDNFYAMTDLSGKYSFSVDTGKYIINQLLPSPMNGKKINQICPPNSYTVIFNSRGDTIMGKDFGNQVTLCPYLATNIFSNRRRRCFLNSTTVYYSNSGVVKAENVKVYVKMPEYVVLKKADKTFTRDSEGNYVFTIGSLEANQSGVIIIQDSVICKSGITGLTACTKAWITPANTCKIPSTNWDKSDIVLSGKCIDNGRVRIVLKNTGEGNMADSSQMRLYLNAALALRKGFKLNKGDSLVLSIPANGKTVRLEADQRPEHPRKSSSNITFEGCVANLSEVVSKGFVNQFPQDDAEPEVSVSCQQIVDSFDPNDKQVEPVGTTVNHYTPTDAELKYLIRFQNTGTDTAYTVTVIDTLSENLDVATLQLGSASHKYSFNLSGKGKPVLTWTFNKINLPDSTKNSLASNGFVAFSIKPKTGLAEKTKIENYADIIFDFNDPVRTNTTFNSIYDVPPVVESSVKLDEKTVIIPKPTITSFSPEGNYNGQQVTITGTNFESKPTDNIVKFNDLIAQVVSGNTTQLVVIVPQGATKGKISVTTQSGTAVSANDFLTSPLAVEPTSDNLITVYPNPTEGIFTVDFGGLQVEEIIIYNALGQKILTKILVNQKSIDFDFQNQVQGLYIIKIKTASQTITKKISFLSK